MCESLVQLSEDEHIALRMEARGADAAQLSRRRQLIRVRRRIANQILSGSAEQKGGQDGIGSAGVS